MNNVNLSYNISSLTKDEVKTILECLLFASSVDVCASFYKEESIKMLDLAKKIRTYFPDVILENVSAFKIKDEDNNLVFHDEHTDNIVSFFPEILQEVKE